MMDRQLGHMVRLIDDLLDIARSARTRLNSVGPECRSPLSSILPWRRPGQPSRQKGTSLVFRFPRNRFSSMPTSPG